MRVSFLLCCVLFLTCEASTQVHPLKWRRWAVGLFQLLDIRSSSIVAAPDHSVYFIGEDFHGDGMALQRAQGYKKSGTFLPLPTPPIFSWNTSIQRLLGCTSRSELLIECRTDWVYPATLFRLDSATKQWIACGMPTVPLRMLNSFARSANGTIWLGDFMGRLYKSTDDGISFDTVALQSGLRETTPCFEKLIPILNKYETPKTIVGIDRRNRIYVAGFIRGLVYSDDEGASWHVVDQHACAATNPTELDTNSALFPLTYADSITAFSFSYDNQIVWSGKPPAKFAFERELFVSNLETRTTAAAVGPSTNFKMLSRKIERIVATQNGFMYLHSGEKSEYGTDTGVTYGIFGSANGYQWDSASEYISGSFLNSGNSLTVDGNRVFCFAKHGDIWVLDADTATVGVDIEPTEPAELSSLASPYPNPTDGMLHIPGVPAMLNVVVYDLQQRIVLRTTTHTNSIDVAGLPKGSYYLRFETVDPDFSVRAATWKMFVKGE